ncbi:MAG: hypothetical protein ABSH32_17945 [Bryobacteraceae bacterium]
MGNTKQRTIHGFGRPVGLLCLALAATVASSAQDEQTSPDAAKFILYSTTSTGGGGYSLLRVGPTTGAQHLVGQSGQAADLSFLTANPVSNVLYGTAYDSGVLYTIDPKSGAISGEVTLSQNVSTIAASANGTLYGLSGNTLGTINTTTGQFSPVGTLSLRSGYFLVAMAFSPGGKLYGVTLTDVGGFDQQLITLNPATGATTRDLGSLTSDYNVGDITYAADGYIYATNFSSALLKIDPRTLSNTVIGSGNIGALGGIAALGSIAGKDR